MEGRAADSVDIQLRAVGRRYVFVLCLLLAPVQVTLFFAGEATDFNGHHGTVHDAIASGQRASAELLSPKPPGILLRVSVEQPHLNASPLQFGWFRAAVD